MNDPGSTVMGAAQRMTPQTVPLNKPQNFLVRLYQNAGTISKFVIAIVSDVQVNMHTGWTNPTGIVTDVLALAVWLVPNAVSQKG